MRTVAYNSCSVDIYGPARLHDPVDVLSLQVAQSLARVFFRNTSLTKETAVSAHPKEA
jgi:hypothetical protein